ncbi:MAG: N-6 DNA methylase [Nitrospirae bacterium]|nr:N-6 DNA methylase [Nitrospirota bacterium]
MWDNEADTCRKYVLPKLYDSGWNDDQISEQKTFTDGRIVVAGTKCHRKKPKRADFLLRYRRDFLIAVVEAKASYKNRGDGLQQAKDYGIEAKSLPYLLSQLNLMLHGLEYPQIDPGNALRFPLNEIGEQL